MRLAAQVISCLAATLRLTRRQPLEMRVFFYPSLPSPKQGEALLRLRFLRFTHFVRFGRNDSILKAQHGFREASKTRRTPYFTPAHQPLEMRAVHEARAFTTGSAIKPTTALAKKILQKDFWRRGGAAEIITTSAPARLYAKFGVRRRSDPEESAARHSIAQLI